MEMSLGVAMAVVLCRSNTDDKSLSQAKSGILLSVCAIEIAVVRVISVCNFGLM